MLVLLALAASQSAAQILYDGALGTPADQGWSLLSLGAATETLIPDGVLLDTSAANSIQAGYPRVLSGLNRTNGFSLLFTAQVLEERHLYNDRAGFSVILLGDDVRGIELGFWTNSIFAQSDSPLFTHAEETNFLTTASVEYALTMHATKYVLSASGVPILTGPVRDYSAFIGLLNPYRTPNFLFFGDDTTSALGAYILKRIALVTPPELFAHADGRILWSGIRGGSYTVLSSTNLSDWIVAGSVTSPNSIFAFTNSASTGPLFFRLKFP